MASKVIFVRADGILTEALRRLAKRERLSVSRLSAVLLRHAVAADTVGKRDLAELEHGNLSGDLT